MTAIAVRERVNEDQAVMEPDGEFIGGIGFVFQPIARIAKQSGESLANFGVRDTYIFSVVR